MAPSASVDLYQTTGSSPPATAAEAHAIGQAIADGAEHLWQLLKRAEAGRAWEPLGLPDLPAFVARYVPAEQRRPLVAELRAEGMSTRAIATATGVSQKQVMRDIKSGESPDSPAPVLRNITTVTGADGKTYPAKPKKAKAPRKPKVKEKSLIEDLAARTRAHNAPGARQEKARLAAVDLIKFEGWSQFTRLVEELAQEYGSP